MELLVRGLVRGRGSPNGRWPAAGPGLRASPAPGREADDGAGRDGGRVGGDRGPAPTGGTSRRGCPSSQDHTAHEGHEGHEVGASVVAMLGRRSWSCSGDRVTTSVLVIAAPPLPVGAISTAAKASRRRRRRVIQSVRGSRARRETCSRSTPRSVGLSVVVVGHAGVCGACVAGRSTPSIARDGEAWRTNWASVSSSRWSTGVSVA